LGTAWELKCWSEFASLLAFNWGWSMKLKHVWMFFVAVFLSVPAYAVSVAEEVESYIALFKGDVAKHSDAADTFVWMGLSDPRLFDIIEQRLLAEHAAVRGDRNEKNRVARYIRALGFSGQEKYAATIKMLVSDKVYERYALAALEDLPNYRRWNPIISNRSSFDPNKSDEMNRVMNMLRANELMLKEIGAKRIYFGVHDPALFDLLAQQVQEFCFNPASDKDIAEAQAWLVKALGSTKQEKYKELLIRVAKTAPEHGVVKHAKKALEKDFNVSL